MSQVNDKDLNAIREWIAKESYLPKNFDDILLKKFIYSCAYSLEKTKQCIDKFCTNRANLVEVYNNRDPTGSKLLHASSTIDVAAFPAGPYEILIHRLLKLTDEFDFYAAVTSFTLFADEWLLRETKNLYEGQIIVIDIGKYSLALLARVNVFYYQKFILYLLESLPIRLKEIHVVNCPPITEYLYNLVKSALPEDIRNMVKFHITSDALKDYIDKKYLPSDYAGMASDIHEESQMWYNTILKRRDFYRNDNLWKAERTTKPKANGKEHNMNGSFRKLAID